MIGGEVRFGLDSRNINRGEDAGLVDIYVLLDKAIGEPTMVYYTADCSRISPSDFDTDPCNGGSIEFGAGDTMRLISLSVRNDTSEEDDETLTLQLTRVNGGYGLVELASAGSSAIVTIVDDDGSSRGG